jgi:hypothetical protein
MPPMPPMGGDPMGGGMPPMGGPDDMGGDPMGGDEGMDDGAPDAEGSEGGAGSDVKEYSGELSQALNTYNEENPNDDEKINKYAINMIAAQVADYLSDKDKRSVIKKLKGDEDDMSSDEQPEMPEDDGGMQPQMESIVREVVDDLVNGRHTKRNERYITNYELNKKKNPFVSKNFNKRKNR